MASDDLIAISLDDRVASNRDGLPDFALTNLAGGPTRSAWCSRAASGDASAQRFPHRACPRAEGLRGALIL
jgi:hypothetical protein